MYKNNLSTNTFTPLPLFLTDTDTPTTESISYETHKSYSFDTNPTGVKVRSKRLVGKTRLKEPYGTVHKVCYRKLGSREEE